jgi:hypothetical protein
MNINRSIIDKLVQSNKNIASLMSSLGKLKEEELSLILDEIAKLKLQEPVKKKIVKKNDIDKKITHSFALLSDMVTKKPKVQKLKPINLIKNIVSPTVQQKKESQSNKNYTRQDSGLDVQEEKLIVLKSIRDHLNTEKIIPEIPKENKSGGFLSNMSSSILGAGVGGILSKGTKALKTVGKFAGKALPIAFALKSGYDLITGIKDGYAEYKRLKASGDNTGANNVLFKTFISSSGNIMGIAGGLIPGPIGWLLTAGSLAIDGIAGEFDSVIADKTNETIQGQQKVSKIQDMIDKGAENNVLLLRPNVKNMSWEYKDYKNDSWETIKDSFGNALSISSSRIQPNEKSENGIQTYKLKSEGRMLDLVLDNGVPKIKDENGLREVTPRKNGGKVNKGNDYLVGEKGPELYKTNNENGLSEVFSGINKSFKKMINGFNVDSLVDFFTPQVTIYKMVPGAGVASSAKQILDFTKISTDKQVRFDSFVEQLFAFEGGYVNEKNDIGGKTKFGITESTWKKYREDINPNANNISEITREDAKKVYQQKYYSNTQASKIDDPALAYLYFDTSVIMGENDANRFLKQSGGDVNKFIELRKKYHSDRVIQRPDQSKFFKGWMNRMSDMESMVSRSVQQARVDSVKNITKPTQLSKKDSIDKEFLLNNIANAMADIVSKHYNGI